MLRKGIEKAPTAAIDIVAPKASERNTIRNLLEFVAEAHVAIVLVLDPIELASVHLAMHARWEVLCQLLKVETRRNLWHHVVQVTKGLEGNVVPRLLWRRLAVPEELDVALAEVGLFCFRNQTQEPLQALSPRLVRCRRRRARWRALLQPSTNGRTQRQRPPAVGAAPGPGI